VRIKGVDGASLVAIHSGGYHWRYLQPLQLGAFTCIWAWALFATPHQPRMRRVSTVPDAASRSARSLSRCVVAWLYTFCRECDRRLQKLSAACHSSEASQPYAAASNWEAKKKPTWQFWDWEIAHAIVKGNAPVLIAQKRCLRYVDRRHWPVRATSLPCWGLEAIETARRKTRLEVFWRSSPPRCV
jgi:hypothetical protein